MSEGQETRESIGTESSPSDPALLQREKQLLEIDELRLKVAGLQRPEYKRPTFWFSVSAALVAIVGVIAQGTLSSIKSERAQLQVEKAETKRDEAQAQLKAAQASFAQVEQTRKTVLNDLRLSAALSSKGGGLFVSKDDIPQVYGFDLSLADDLTANEFNQLRQLSKLTHLRGRTDQLDVLGRLEHLSSLTITLDLHDQSDPAFNMISSDKIAPLEALTDIKQLVFTHLIQSVKPLQALRNLESLEIGTTWSGVGALQTEDEISTVRSLKKLKTLILHGSYDQARQEFLRKEMPHCEIAFRE